MKDTSFINRPASKFDFAAGDEQFADLSSAFESCRCMPDSTPSKGTGSISLTPRAMF